MAVMNKNDKNVLARRQQAARRALIEAEQRRNTTPASKKPAPETGGHNGVNEPTRYGDWEKNGLISDF